MADPHEHAYDPGSSVLSISSDARYLEFGILHRRVRARHYQNVQFGRINLSSYGVFLGDFVIRELFEQRVSGAAVVCALEMDDLLRLGALLTILSPCMN